MMGVLCVHPNLSIISKSLSLSLCPLRSNIIMGTGNIVAISGFISSSPCTMGSAQCLVGISVEHCNGFPFNRIFPDDKNLLYHLCRLIGGSFPHFPFVTHYPLNGPKFKIFSDLCVQPILISVESSYLTWGCSNKIIVNLGCCPICHLTTLLLNFCHWVCVY